MIARRYFLSTSLAFLLVGTAPRAEAADWAFDGYDPVALRREGRAVPGASTIHTYWQGKVWHFATKENRALFEANPRSFAPGFDGLCPTSLQDGRPSAGSAHYFVIIGDRVYLTRSEAARDKLLADPRGVLMAAKASWLRLGH